MGDGPVDSCCCCCCCMNALFSSVSLWIDVARYSCIVGSLMCLPSCLLTFLQLHRYPLDPVARRHRGPFFSFLLPLIPCSVLHMVFSYVSGCLPLLLFIVSAWTKIFANTN